VRRSKILKGKEITREMLKNQHVTMSSKNSEKRKKKTKKDKTRNKTKYRACSYCSVVRYKQGKLSNQVGKSTTSLFDAD
jgi:hypothetical protein